MIMIPPFLDIYIPLCLYFNSYYCVSAYYRRVFTFHYVSILIILLIKNLNTLSTFTFHYVSILIQHIAKAEEGQVHLHSIMSLF